jgi:hypothetical protein
MTVKAQLLPARQTRRSAACWTPTELDTNGIGRRRGNAISHTALVAEPTLAM